MKNKLNQLDYIINLDKLQNIQDDIARATDMAVITIDYTGNPVTAHSYCSEFCQRVRQNHELGQYCEKCDSRGGLEAARDKEPYIYICHIGVVDFAVPIIVEGQYIGAIMAGQIRLKDINNTQELERIVSKRYQHDIEADSELKVLYDQLPSVSLDKIKAVAQMIYHLVNHIIGEAVLKTSLYEANQKLYEDTIERSNKNADNPDKVHLYYASTESESNRTTKKENVQLECLSEVPENSLLRPALIYVKEHLEEKIYLDKMSYLCNISSSYFSKIFRRETGYNFSTYVTRSKLMKVKELLETTDLSVSTIALNFSFDDSGYLIKLFKKAYGVTPAVYRKKFQEQREH